MFNFFRFQQNYERSQKLRELLSSTAEVTVEEVLDYGECADELKSNSQAAELLWAN